MNSYRSILKLVWPLALGMVNNASMQFCDRLFLSLDSLEALDAVLPAGMLTSIFAGFFQSVVGYASVFVGQHHGAGDDEGCRAAYRAALRLALWAGLAGLPVVALGWRLLALASPSAAVLSMERTYFAVTMLGAVFLYGQIAAASYFTGCGRTRRVFWVNLLGNALNVALDPILIFGCGLGIAGAALATTVSMAVQFAVLVRLAEREVGAGARVPRRRIRTLQLSIVRYGAPAGAYNVLNLLSFTIFVFVTRGVGPLELAVSNACFTVNYLLFAPMEGFALGASTLVAQAKGRGDADGARLAVRRTLLLGVGFAAVASALALVFSRPILALFSSCAGESAETFQSLGFTLFVLMAAWQLFDAADVILSGALKGAGDTRFVMLWMLVSSFGLWLPLVAVVACLHRTMPCLWATTVVYVVVICAGTAVRWCRGRWKEIRLT